MAADITGKDRMRERYEDVCGRLGFDPAVNFVRINTNGEISFSAGKPDEVRSLLAAVLREGMKPSQGLIVAAR